MKINANDLKIGNIIQHNNSLWKVAKLSHTQPGKGGAYIQAELKNITNQSKLTVFLMRTPLVEVKKKWHFLDRF